MKHIKKKLIEYGWPKAFRVEDWARDYKQTCQEAWDAQAAVPDPPYVWKRSPESERNGSWITVIGNFFGQYFHRGQSNDTGQDLV